MDAEFPATIVQIGADSHLHCAMVAFSQVSLQELAVDVFEVRLMARGQVFPDRRERPAFHAPIIHVKIGRRFTVNQRRERK